MNTGLKKVLNFEGQEIKVITNEGNELFNLANSAMVLGLVINDKKKNSIRIAWKGNRSVYDKLSKLKTTISSVEANASLQYIEELDYILNEIENGDDRNSIFMSRYLTSRISMECHSDKANSYKDWLAKLDESYSKGELTVSQSDITNMVSNLMNNIMPTLIESTTKQFTPILNETRKQVEEAKEQVEDITKRLGLKSRNTAVIGRKLTSKESEFYGRRIYANGIEHKFNRNKLLNHFNVLALEDINIKRFDEICDYVEDMELTPIEEIEKYLGINRIDKAEYLKVVKDL